MGPRLAGEHPGVHLTLSLTLPRDEMTVPVARHVVRSSMREVGVDANCVSDIEIALTEACTNVLDHAAAGDEYEVAVGLDDATCVIEVIDTGRGFDADRLGHAEADPSAEEGRGIQLIRALVDRVHFRSRAEAGTVVRLEKELEFAEGAPLRQLADRGTDTVALELGEVQKAIDERDDLLESAPPHPG